MHLDYSGVIVILQLAIRENLRNFPFLLKDPGHHVSLSKIKRTVATCGPDQPGSLALGIAFVRSLGLILKCKMMYIHHLRVHIFPFHR